MPIFDTNENPLSSATISIEQSGSKEFSIIVEPISTSTLSMDANSDLKVFARLDAGDPWQDIAVTPLDLSAFASTLKLVLMRLDAEPAAVIGQTVLEIILSE